MNNVRKKGFEEFHIFVKFFLSLEFQPDLPTEFLPDSNGDANYYNTEHLYTEKNINRLVLFLTVLDIPDDESANSTFRNKN